MRRFLILITATATAVGLMAAAALGTAEGVEFTLDNTCDGVVLSWSETLADHSVEVIIDDSEVVPYDMGAVTMTDPLPHDAELDFTQFNVEGDAFPVNELTEFDGTYAQPEDCDGSDSKEISAKALDDHECDSSEWHFVINQVESEELAPDSITVEFSGGDTVVVELDEFTGGVAHYTEASHLDETVVSATATIYEEWDGQFNLSHGPCDDTTTTTQPEETTTTTAPKETTTTAPQETTTVPEETTTTQPEAKATTTTGPVVEVSTTGPPPSSAPQGTGIGVLAGVLAIAGGLALLFIRGFIRRNQEI